MDDYPMQLQQQYDEFLSHALRPICYHCRVVLEGPGVPIRILIGGTKLIGGQFCAACALDPVRVIA